MSEANTLKSILLLAANPKGTVNLGLQNLSCSCIRRHKGGGSLRPLLTELLGLPGIDVENEHIFDDKIILEVERQAVKAVCTRCGFESTQMHQNHGYFVRDLNLMHRQVLLKVKRRQFKCTPCGKPFSEALDFVGRKRTYTDRFSEMIAQQVIHSSIHNVAQKPALSDDAVWSMVQDVSKKNQP